VNNFRDDLAFRFHALQTGDVEVSNNNACKWQDRLSDWWHGHQTNAKKPSFARAWQRPAVCFSGFAVTRQSAGKRLPHHFPWTRDRRGNSL